MITVTAVAVVMVGRTAAAAATTGPRHPSMSTRSRRSFLRLRSLRIKTRGTRLQGAGRQLRLVIVLVLSRRYACVLRLLSFSLFQWFCDRGFLLFILVLFLSNISLPLLKPVANPFAFCLVLLSRPTRRPSPVVMGLLGRVLHKWSWLRQLPTRHDDRIA